MKQKVAGESTRRGRESVELVAKLRAQILSGKLIPGTFLPTVRVLSEQQNVAHGTAFKALKSLEVEGLIEAYPRLGYCVSEHSRRPSAVATIAYMMDQQNLLISWNVIYRHLLEMLEYNTNETQIRLIKLLMNPGQEDLVESQLSSTKLDGIVLDSLNRRLLGYARERSIPAVVVDDWAEDLWVDSVVQGNFEGGELASRYLVEQGCQRIAWLGSMENHHARFRYGGAHTGIACAGKSFSHTLNGELSEAAIREGAKKLFAGPDRPDGIIAFWYFSAVYQAGLEVGLQPGRDYKMVCWCPEEVLDTHYCAQFAGHPVPPAVCWSIRCMAETALSRLEARRKHPGLPHSSSRVPVKLSFPKPR